MPTAPYNLRLKHMTTAPKTPDKVQVRDTFETPAYAIDLLTPYLPKDVPFTVWECAAGNGRIAERIKQNLPNAKILATDIRDTDYILSNGFLHNFLSDFDLIKDIGDSLEEKVIIITNPPFSVKEEFINKAFQYNLPFAFLINADYSGEHIKWIGRGCSKIIPTRRIDYITPNVITRVNEGEGTAFEKVSEIPQDLIKKYSSSQAHSMWLTYGLGLTVSEVFVDLPKEWKKERILWEENHPF